MENKKTITVFNKGHRQWTLKDYTGKNNTINPGQSVVCEMKYGQKMAKSYSHDLTISKPSVIIDQEALKRREQIVTDKEKTLVAREKEFNDIETKLAAKEKELATKEKELNEKLNSFSGKTNSKPITKRPIRK